MLINLELLRTFAAVAVAPTFARAAAERRVTPSAVSQQMKTLEANLGVALFRRAGRRSLLTPAGQSLLASVRAGLALLEQAVEDAAQGQELVRGPVRIGGPAPFCKMWLRPRLVPLLRAHPDLELEVEFGVPSSLTRRLGDSELDLAVLVEMPSSPALETALVHVEEFVAVASPEYLAKHGTARSAAELAAHRFIAFDQDLPMLAPWWRASFGRRVPLPSRMAARVGNLDEMLALAVAGLGVAVLPSYFVADALASGAVRLVSPSSRRPARNAIHLAWRRSSHEPLRLRVVRDALLAGGAATAR